MAGGREVGKHLFAVPHALGEAIEVTVASPLPDAPSQGQGELWDTVSVTSHVSDRPRSFSESSGLNR